jgi:hypothetical protein
LDNFEHLLGPVSSSPDEENAVGNAAEFVSQILAAAPNLKLLVTSREALNLQEAWFHPVAEMAFPIDAATYTFAGDEGYVRAKVLESNGKVAWTQPVGVGAGAPR